jgi:GH15 family glucan-1,4-alpha-glucosidase
MTIPDHPLVPSAATHNLNVWVVGNCSINALIDDKGRIVWMCLPRFDGDPVFCDLVNHPSDPSLLDEYGANREGGFWDIILESCVKIEQRYEHNTAIVVTTMYDSHGGSIEVVDFCPRFELHGRMFRPVMLVRRVFWKSGDPRIKIRVRPLCEYGATKPEITRGSNHVRYVMPGYTARLTTDAPISYLLEDRFFLLDKELNFTFGPDEPLSKSAHDICAEFQEHTAMHWRSFVRGLAIPFEYQQAVIRAAIALKLSCYEETGAIVAAMTTSIPEHDHSQRNWDYRFSWLRDSLYTVHALNALGATDTMEAYLNFVLDVVAQSPDGVLQPLFGLSREHVLTEESMNNLAGYRGLAPVRRGNGAYTQVQHDSYGSCVLALTQLFFDERLNLGDPHRIFARLEKLGHVAARVYKEPDAGLWELRGRQHVHTYSSLMCWVACDRLALIAGKLGLAEKEKMWKGHAEMIRDFIWNNCWNEEKQTFVSFVGGDDVDACLLTIHEFGFLPPTHPRFVSTVEACEKRLRCGSHMYRYLMEDDFGKPVTIFNLCSFWLISSLHAIGRTEEARQLFNEVLSCRTPSGLLSEDLDVATGQLWGNIPQTYSLVGIIQCARKLSKEWTSAF